MTATLRISAIVMATGVALGAFGAHGLEEVLQRRGMEDTWGTGVLYHLVHGVSLLALAALPTIETRRQRLVGWLWLAGIILFCGSLYGLSLVSWKALGPITPLGGLCFIAGWIVLALAKPVPRP